MTNELVLAKRGHLLSSGLMVVLSFWGHYCIGTYIFDTERAADFLIFSTVLS